MASQKPSIPRGTRDFSPTEMNRRNYIFNTIREVFQQYGYAEIQTPAMENLSTLLGKYGEEGDKLLFNVLNSGDYLKDVPREVMESADPVKMTGFIAEKGLRYDLTVPFARFVTQYRNDIAFPFKRFQIQPVWRADKPQKGRYREFYQCDADVVGSTSLLNELELLQITDAVFTLLRLEISIRINNRKLLAGIAEYIGASGRFRDLTMAMDKLDKTGSEKVLKELQEKGFDQQSLSLLTPVLDLKGSNEEKMAQLEGWTSDSEMGQTGMRELRYIFERLPALDLKADCELDLTLARGLDYYTGAIIEVKSKEMAMGSIGGGGRYDNLTGVFGLPDVSGVGISFGADRIYDVLENLNRFPAETAVTSSILFLNFGEEELMYCLPVAEEIRKAGIRAEIYPDSAKLKKQFSYADKKNIPLVAMAGENEIREGRFTLKNMRSGEQTEVRRHELITYLKQNI